MTYTEIKERADRKYYYRVKSVRKGKKVEKERIYLGANLNKQQVREAENKADGKLLQKSEPVKEKEKKTPRPPAQKKTTFGISKEKDFSQWYTEIVKRAELGDLRYNVKGFLVFQPWSVLCMEKMYGYFEKVLQGKGHKPYWFPAVIPEENFKKEASHIDGFAPDVFWLEKKQGEERLGI